MAAATTSETWDAAWTLTMRAHRKRLTDNVFDEYPTLQMFKQAGNIETESGGKEIKEDLLYGKNSAEWFSDYDTLNTDAVDGITAAFYPWRYQAVPITISMTEEMESRKSDAAVKLLQATFFSLLQARAWTLDPGPWALTAGRVEHPAKYPRPERQPHTRTRALAPCV